MLDGRPRAFHLIAPPSPNWSGQADWGRKGRDGGCDPERSEMVEACLKLLEQGYYEVKIAFEGLADENVWKRPAPGLLSVGELAGHLAFWDAVRLAGDGPDPAQCRVSSPLIDR